MAAEYDEFHLKYQAELDKQIAAVDQLLVNVAVSRVQVQQESLKVKAAFEALQDMRRTRRNKRNHHV